MTTEITAIFDSPDTAELALSQLRAGGVPPLSFSIRPLRRGRPAPDGAIAAYYAAGMQYSPSTSGFNAAAFTAAPLASGWPSNDEEKREALLTAIFPAPAAARARSIMISAHGRRVR